MFRHSPLCSVGARDHELPDAAGAHGEGLRRAAPRDDGQVRHGILPSTISWSGGRRAPRRRRSSRPRCGWWRAARRRSRATFALVCATELWVQGRSSAVGQRRARRRRGRRGPRWSGAGGPRRGRRSGGCGPLGAPLAGFAHDHLVRMFDYTTGGEGWAQEAPGKPVVPTGCQMYGILMRPYQAPSRASTVAGAIGRATRHCQEHQWRKSSVNALRDCWADVRLPRVDTAIDLQMYALIVMTQTFAICDLPTATHFDTGTEPARRFDG